MTQLTHTTPNAKIATLQAMYLSTNLELQFWLISGAAIIMGIIISCSFNLHLNPISIDLQADPTPLFAETSGSLG